MWHAFEDTLPAGFWTSPPQRIQRQPAPFDTAQILEGQRVFPCLRAPTAASLEVLMERVLQPEAQLRCKRAAKAQSLACGLLQLSDALQDAARCRTGLSSECNDAEPRGAEYINHNEERPTLLFRSCQRRPACLGDFHQEFHLKTTQHVWNQRRACTSECV